jgi:hypothetical protein
MPPSAPEKRADPSCVGGGLAATPGTKLVSGKQTHATRLIFTLTGHIVREYHKSLRKATITGTQPNLCRTTAGADFMMYLSRNRKRKQISHDALGFWGQKDGER